MTDVEVPEGLRYTAEHEWVADAGDGVVRVGITAYAQGELGDIVYVSLPQVGQAGVSAYAIRPAMR